MKLQLKKIEVNDRMSAETYCFVADLWVDGVKVGCAQNRGCGGSTYYTAYEGQREKLRAAEDYIASQPQEDRLWRFTLADWIDERVHERVLEVNRRKQLAEIKRRCKTAICWGIPGDNGYNYQGLVGNPQLVDIYRNPRGKAAIDKMVASIKASLEPGEEIFNTNIPVN